MKGKEKKKKKKTKKQKQQREKMKRSALLLDDNDLLHQVEIKSRSGSSLIASTCTDTPRQRHRPNKSFQKRCPLANELEKV